MPPVCQCLRHHLLQRGVKTVRPCRITVTTTFAVQALVMAQSVHLQDLGSGNTPVFVSPAFSAVTPAHTADVGATPMEDDTNARTRARPDAMLTGMSGRSTGNPMANTGQPRATTLARIAAANAACLSEIELVRLLLYP